MNKVRYISAICLLLCSLAVSAQTFERVYDNNFWNRSRNVTGVRQDSVSRSYAELYGGYESGEFRDTWQAEESWHAGAVTASIQHMEKMSLTGSFSFTQTEGYRQCGSMFINPGFYPVDILEFTPGRKTLQEYRFNGGISYDVASKWRIGARMDFESANISKKKDLRHMNYLLDMTVTPGFMYHDGNFAVGASAIFRKTSERIEAEQVGTSESSYYAFLDKGLMYGVHSVWNGSGLHLEESGVNGFPVKDFTYGGAVQLQYKGVFAELEYSETSGTVGEKEYIWFLFPGKEAKAMLGFRHNSGNETHLGRVNLGWKQRSLDENVLEKVSENGVATVICHGKNRIFTEGIWNLSPEYEYIADRIEFKARLDLDWQEGIASQMYPYISTQRLMTGNAYFRTRLHLGIFDLDINFRTGWGDVTNSSRTADAASGVEGKPYRLEGWYNRHIEFMTAPYIGAGAAIKCNFWKGMYVKASGEWLAGECFRIINGPGRLETTLRIGYNF